MFLLRIFLIVFLGVAVRIGINFLCLPGVYGPEGAGFMVEEAKQNPEYRDLAQNYKSYIGFIIFSICIILGFAVIFFCGAAYWIDNRPNNIVFTGIVGFLIMIYVIWTIQFQKKIIEQLQLRNQERSQEEILDCRDMDFFSAFVCRYGFPKHKPRIPDSGWGYSRDPEKSGTEKAKS